MTSWFTRKGLGIPSKAANDAGTKLKDDLTELSDRAPFNSASNPTVNDDAEDGFIAGSHWFNTTSQTMWVCTDATTAAAKWRSLYKRIDNAIVLAPEAGVGSGSDARAIQLDTGGNTRGSNAIDFQRTRANSNQVASGSNSFIGGGINNRASGSLSFITGGYANLASGSSSHAQGSNCIASSGNSHAEGNGSQASGLCSHAEGSGTVASGYYTHTEGFGTVAIGRSAHAEGEYTSASGNYAHAEGTATTASNFGSHAEGMSTTASGDWGSHAEGASTVASGPSSHAEGSHTIANGEITHAEGLYTTASGLCSHAEGGLTTASGYYTHAGGVLSKAHLHAQWAHASGGFIGSQLGTAQTTITHLYHFTNNATAKELTLNGSSPNSTSRFAILDGQTLSCFINIVGRKVDPSGNDNASFLRQVCIYREGSTTALVGSVQTVGTDINPAGWGGVTITADDTNESLKIEVTGVASTNIRWMATVIASEVADAAI